MTVQTDWPMQMILPITCKETVQKALAQIEIKKYDVELKERGIPKERIRHYGFAFEGKKVLIG